MATPVSRTVLLLLLALLGAVGVPAAAQETYTLDAEDAWARGDELDPESMAGQLAEARRALARDDAVRAENIATQLIERYPRHLLLPEAYLLRGDALIAQSEYYKALFEYEQVVRVYPGSEAFITALQREFDIAKRFAAGMRRKVLGMRIADASDEAEELFIRIQERLPGSRLAEEAGMALGDFYFSRRRMSLAVEAYSLCMENYPNSEQINTARRRLIYAYLASFKGPEFDATGLKDARIQLDRLKAISPTTAEKIGAEALIARIDESRAQKMLTTARWYLRTRDILAAELTIRRLVKRYPRSLAAAEALRLVPDILPRLPQRVIDQAPDYEALRRAVLGTAQADESTASDADGLESQPPADTIETDQEGAP